MLFILKICENINVYNELTRRILQVYGCVDKQNQCPSFSNA